jgi:hypothetical protein
MHIHYITKGFNHVHVYWSIYLSIWSFHVRIDMDMDMDMLCIQIWNMGSIWLMCTNMWLYVYVMNKDMILHAYGLWASGNKVETPYIAGIRNYHILNKGIFMIIFIPH